MLRKLGLLTLILSLVWIGYPTANAQDNGNPWATYQLNMRTGPGPDYAVVAVIQGGTRLVLEARNDDISWVLGHTEDGAFRGWMFAIYLTYPEGYAAARLPVSGEIVGAAAPPPADPGQPPAPPPSGDVTAFTTYQVNVRSGPGTNFGAIAVLDGGTGLIPEARNGDSSWILARTADGTVRGWMAGLYIRFTGISASSLPYSEEFIAPPSGGASTSQGAPVTGGSYDGIIMGSFDPATVASIDLAAVPIVGGATSRARAIFYTGKDKGRNPNVLAKIGDCSTEHWYFLKSFAWGDYDLGAYSNLQGVIDHFGPSLAYDSQASHNGYNVNSVMNPDWADPGACLADESPMDCEYRINNPSVAIIMFGTSDLLSMSAYEFDFYLRDIVRITAEQGIIPILSTFPGNLGFPNHTILFNQIVVKIAWDNDIPLINLWLALESLPNHGLESDGFHLDEPPDANACYLVGAYLQNGYPVRNLVTLQTLDAVWRGAMQ
jgi:uncharacterized protein YraI